MGMNYFHSQAANIPKFAIRTNPEIVNRASLMLTLYVFDDMINSLKISYSGIRDAWISITWNSFFTWSFRLSKLKLRRSIQEWTK